ncbi:MAG: homoserine kinase [Bacteroidota bacterium]
MKVKIPASTSNIGPGFDTLGLALNRYLYLSVERESAPPSSLNISVEGNGKEHIAKDETNLVYQGMAALANFAGTLYVKSLQNIHLQITNEIPSCGGLGGSGAAIAGGIFLANELLSTKMSREEMLNIAVSIEGHPDNVSAAMMGGLTVNCFDRGRLRCRSIKLASKLSVVTCSPNFQVLTKQARQILPKEVPLKDAVVNIENVASLIAAIMEGDVEALRYATGDRLHEQYRAALIPGFAEVKKGALDAGALSFNISGSGPTVFSFATSGEKRIGEAMVNAFSARGISSTYEIMTVENKGARVIE